MPTACRIVLDQAVERDRRRRPRRPPPRPARGLGGGDRRRPGGGQPRGGGLHALDDDHRRRRRARRLPGGRQRRDRCGRRQPRGQLPDQCQRHRGDLGGDHDLERDDRRGERQPRDQLLHPGPDRRRDRHRGRRRRHDPRRPDRGQHRGDQRRDRLPGRGRRRARRPGRHDRGARATPAPSSPTAASPPATSPAGTASRCRREFTVVAKGGTGAQASCPTPFMLKIAFNAARPDAQQRALRGQGRRPRHRVLPVCRAHRQLHAAAPAALARRRRRADRRRLDPEPGLGRSVSWAGFSSPSLGPAPAGTAYVRVDVVRAGGGSGDGLVTGIDARKGDTAALARLTTTEGGGDLRPGRDRLAHHHDQRQLRLEGGLRQPDLGGDRPGRQPRLDLGDAAEGRRRDRRRRGRRLHQPGRRRRSRRSGGPTTTSTSTAGSRPATW